MGIKFHGGPYDGVETDYITINKHASVLPVHSDLGMRIFVLMPPRERWAELLRGEPAETNPIYPYECVTTPEETRFEWPPPGGFEQALLEAKLKVHPRAQAALSTLGGAAQSAMIREASKLHQTEPDSWSKEHPVQASADQSVYLLRVGDLVGFVRRLESGQIELFDVAREDTLRLFLKNFREAGAAG